MLQHVADVPAAPPESQLWLGNAARCRQLMASVFYVCTVPPSNDCCGAFQAFNDLHCFCIPSVVQQGGSDLQGALRSSALLFVAHNACMKGGETNAPRQLPAARRQACLSFQPLLRLACRCFFVHEKDSSSPRLSAADPLFPLFSTSCQDVLRQQPVLRASRPHQRNGPIMLRLHAARCWPAFDASAEGMWNSMQQVRQEGKTEAAALCCCCCCRHEHLKHRAG